MPPGARQNVRMCGVTKYTPCGLMVCAKLNVDSEATVGIWAENQQLLHVQYVHRTDADTSMEEDHI